MDFRCQICLLNFQSSPIVLTCGWTVCDTHLKSDELTKCALCKKNHRIGDGKINPINKSVEIQLNKLELMESYVKISRRIIDLKQALRDPYDYIYQYFEKLIYKIDLRREETIESVKDHFNSIIERLIEERDRLKANLQDETKFCLKNKDLSIIEDKLSELINESVKNKNVNLKVIEANLTESKSRLKEIEASLNQMFQSLLDHKAYDLSVQSLDLNNADIFGQLVVKKSINFDAIINGKSIETFGSYDLAIFTLLVSESENFLIFSPNNFSISIWDIKARTCLKDLNGHTSFVSALVMSRKSELVSGSWDNQIKVWLLDKGVCANTLIGHSGPIYALCAGTRRRLFSGSHDKSIKVWNIDNGVCLKTLNGHVEAVLSLCVSSNHESWLISGAGDNSIRIWNTESGLTIKTLAGHVSGVSALVQDSKLLVSGSYDKTIKVWNIESGSCEATLNGHSNHVKTLFLKDKVLYSGSSDNTIKAWSLESMTCLRTLTGHTDCVSSLAFSKNEELLSGSYDKTIKVWE